MTEYSEIVLQYLYLLLKAAFDTAENRPPEGDVSLEGPSGGTHESTRTFCVALFYDFPTLFFGHLDLLGIGR